VAGFELLLPPMVQRRIDAGMDALAAGAHRVALLATVAAVTAEGRAALVRMPAQALQREAVCDAVPAGTLLWVDALPSVAPAALAAMRRRGVGVGVPDGPPSRDFEVEFVVLQATAGGLDTLLLSAQRWREAWPRITVVALGLDHVDDVERALRSGVNLAGGQFGRGPLLTPTRPLGAAAHRICELLNHLALDRDTAVIAEAVRADVALTYRLLRYANSPAIGLSRPVEEVDQAVQVLGRTELYRWLSVLLMSTAEARVASKALQELALARGRLLETLARKRGEDNSGALFTVGMMSLIEPLMQVPMATALAPLRLGEDACRALLQRQGPWAEFLALLEAIDAGNTAAQERSATALGVAGLVAEAAEQAWAWAAQAQAA
jgi:EAL and modified HD-GYP domain-containing signal transduction protein